LVLGPGVVRRWRPAPGRGWALDPRAGLACSHGDGGHPGPPVPQGAPRLGQRCHRCGRSPTGWGLPRQWQAPHKGTRCLVRRLGKAPFYYFFKKRRSHSSSSHLLLLPLPKTDVGDGAARISVRESRRPGLTPEALLVGLRGGCGSPRLLLLLTGL